MQNTTVEVKTIKELFSDLDRDNYIFSLFENAEVSYINLFKKSKRLEIGIELGCLMEASDIRKLEQLITDAYDFE